MSISKYLNKRRKREIKIPRTSAFQNIVEILGNSLINNIKKINDILQNTYYSNSTSNSPQNNTSSSQPMDQEEAYPHNRSNSLEIFIGRENHLNFIPQNITQPVVDNTLNAYNDFFKTKSTNDELIDNISVDEYYSRAHSLITDDLINKCNQILIKMKNISKLMKDNNIEENKLFIRRANGYEIISDEKKGLYCELVKSMGIQKVVKYFNLSKKTVQRWMKFGPIRKKGGGRKVLDPEMEKKVFEWYNIEKNLGKKISAGMIKKKAIELSNSPNFQASKGWYEKFRKKNNIITDRIRIKYKTVK